MIKHKTKLWYQYIRSRTKSNLFKYTKAVVKPDSRCYDACINMMGDNIHGRTKTD